MIKARKVEHLTWPRMTLLKSEESIRRIPVPGTVFFTVFFSSIAAATL